MRQRDTELKVETESSEFTVFSTLCCYANHNRAPVELLINWTIPVVLTGAKNHCISTIEQFIERFIVCTCFTKDWDWSWNDRKLGQCVTAIICVTSLFFYGCSKKHSVPPALQIFPHLRRKLLSSKQTNFKNGDQQALVVCMSNSVLRKVI